MRRNARAVPIPKDVLAAATSQVLDAVREHVEHSGRLGEVTRWQADIVNAAGDLVRVNLRVLLMHWSQPSTRSFYSGGYTRFDPASSPPVAHIILELNSSVSPIAARQQLDTTRLPQELARAVLHEMTHALDPALLRQATNDWRRRLAQDDWEPPKPVEYRALRNQPQEVRAVAQEVSSEALAAIQRFSPGASRSRAAPSLLDWSLAYSPSWEWAQEHLSTRNQHAILKAAYTTLRDNGYDPTQKVR